MPWWGESSVSTIAVTLTTIGGVLLATEIARIWQQPERSVFRRWMAFVVVAWSAAAGVELKSAFSSSSAISESDDDQATAGMVAAAVVAHVLTRRREQMRTRRLPDRLSPDETLALGRFVADSTTARGATEEVDLSAVADPAVRLVLDAVDRPVRSSEMAGVVGEWSALLRVYGAPRVETADGQLIEYRKSRALELTAWLAFNRDRRSRSAARTAIWDIEISDATFTTVVSDLRRALSTVDNSTSGGDWLPTTYTDEIELSGRLVTDADLLRSTYAAFERCPGVESDLYGALVLVRDVPFAGTRWSWADLDGTTTRLVILAVDASIAAAEFALDVGRADLLEIATTAGFRVMPGCPELVAIQQSFLSRVSMSR